jgi:hypothetical protein
MNCHPEELTTIFVIPRSEATRDLLLRLRQIVLQCSGDLLVAELACQI